MADVTKLAGSFSALKICLLVDHHLLRGAMQHCRNLGLQPVDAENNGQKRAMFEVLLPEAEDAKEAFGKEMSQFKCSFLSPVQIQLICPVST